MPHFHAVMIDETGCEFGAGVDARDIDDAAERLREDYPESSIAQLESTEQTRKREFDMYQHIMDGGDWDDEGRPFFPHGSPRDDDEEEDC